VRSTARQTASFAGTFGEEDPEELHSYLLLPDRPAMLTMRERRRIWGAGHKPPRHPLAAWGDYADEP